ncbi:adenine deaminase C-terminal domain-containing protein [Halobacillus karajensis]|uniref:adenine deaminase n=1 Tax=Halobacillus karajensis TaxID=195088 RepID=A0A024P4V5_9BACI|nr:adenine deaminase C-terminal domain-containing protein [Halobacillus karajensis]CDQ20615.1 Putative adenine deaminase YerA [Halobacillus karajensis]CDQ23915.1 Putative adenine deaminase YerA [Halobacillus karajensis]CDQ27393.1 Putative adenine deaminase YerA [Halobacillus karajensis]
MNETRFRWRNRQLREHAAVIDGKTAPTKLIKNTTYLNVYMKKWMDGHIWLYHDRIIYTGKELPSNTEGTEIIDGRDSYIVPGYVEPHAHPFQLYNPQSFAEYAAETGTTTLVNDNLMWLFLTEKEKAFSLLEEFMKLPATMYWWARFDPQSVLRDEDRYAFDSQVPDWIAHDAVIQGGELTAWPDVLHHGDEQLLHFMQETKRSRKPLEAHLPGASEQTLVKMRLLGMDSEHEAMTAEDVLKRLEIGYQTGLRYSSIRPDLPDILSGLVEQGQEHFDHMMYTTDGSTPGFYREGLINPCIQIAIDAGVPAVDAYMMATYQPACHFGVQHRVGSLNAGRVAHLNFLSDPEDPNPHSVIAKGKWMKRGGKVLREDTSIQWKKNGIKPLNIDWTLTEADMQFSMPIGLDMVNDVIMKPYAIDTDVSPERLNDDSKESFLMLLDREGKWMVNTLLKGFTQTLGALASSYSNMGDVILTGKSRKDMNKAFQRMKEIGGGIVLVNDGNVLFELPLPLGGVMSELPMPDLIKEEALLKQYLRDYGFSFNDPVYTLLFLSSMHLPYIRITPLGIMDVKKKEVLFPSIMR